MKNIPDSLTPDQAWQRLAACSPLPAESRNLDQALGHILAEDVFVPEDVPIGNRSFMDGFALRSEDVKQAPARLELIGEVLMGETPSQRIGAGQTVAIPTGGFLPEGANAVVMQEDTSMDGNSILVKKTLVAGENVQARAEDYHKGDLLFSGGHRLRPQDLSAVGTFGITALTIIRKPSIAIISTGNELVPMDSKVADASQIRETNSLALASAASKFSFTAERLGIVADELDAQRSAMNDALRRSDVVLVSGGSSVGVRDYTLQVIQSFPHHKIHFHGLAIRPGNPTIFASIGSQYVFGLPGQPVSSLIVFYLFVLPFLLHLSGEKTGHENFLNGRFQTVSSNLVHEIMPLKTKTDYVRLRLTPHGAIPVTGKSASLSTLTSADGFTIVPPGEKPFPKNSSIKVFLFP